MSAIADFQSQIPQMDTMHLKLPQQMTFQSAGNASNATQTGLTTRRQKFKLEPIKILEPSNKKLTLPEAQRIMYILEELIKKLETVNYINMIMNNEAKVRQLISVNLSDDDKKKNLENIFMSMFQHHKALVDSYNSGQFNDPGAKNSQTKESLESLIKSSTKDILRVFHTKPALYESLKTELAKAKSNHPHIVDLIGTLNEAKDVLHERLLTTPTEQNEKLEYLKELLSREKANNELIKKLRDEQSVCLAEKDKEIQVRNDQIRKLDNDLKNVERFSSDLVKRTKMDAEQLEASETKASDQRKAKLQQELNQLRQHFQNLVLEHKEQEQQLRKEKWKNETNVEGLLNRYDDDMSKKQAEYDEIEALYEEEKKLLVELEDKFKPLEEEYIKIKEERQMLEAIRRMEEESLNKKIKAAVVIQSYWRGFKLRKGLFKKGKGKGKKGKKGKK